jgi:activator of HSP90 ATPase
MCKTIKQKVSFKAPPEIVYGLLIDSKKHTSMTGEMANISNQIGGHFSAYNGDITGINVDLLPSKRIVQAWRGERFPEGIFSMASFFLAPNKVGGTELILTHRGVPKELISGIEMKWKEFYWDKMKKYIALQDLSKK